MMTNLTRAALTAAIIAATAVPALAQNAPMGAPSDAAPPAPAQVSPAADTTPVKDPAAPKLTRVHHMHRHHVVAHKAVTVTKSPMTAQTGS